MNGAMDAGVSRRFCNSTGTKVIYIIESSKASRSFLVTDDDYFRIIYKAEKETRKRIWNAIRTSYC